MFHICTIANDREQYAAMKQSFLDRGFTEPACRFALFDNSDGNRFEPYSVFNSVRAETTAPYILFCHQDIRMDRGLDFERIQQLLDELDSRDRRWAVAGNAGVNEYFQTAWHIHDPNGDWTHGELPAPVLALDENFLVVKTRANVSCSPQLSGFHLYGADLCFNARKNGHTCYAGDFYLTHLSSGNTETEDFRTAVCRFRQVWNPEFRFLYVQTTSTSFFLSRYPFIARLFDHPRIRFRVINHPSLYRWLLRQRQKRR